MWTSNEVEAARHLLWHYREPGGVEPGSFSQALINALERADSHNRVRLLLAFPEYLRPVRITMTDGAAFLAGILEHELNQRTEDNQQ